MDSRRSRDQSPTLIGWQDLCVTFCISTCVCTFVRVCGILSSMAMVTLGGLSLAVPPSLMLGSSKELFLSLVFSQGFKGQDLLVDCPRRKDTYILTLWHKQCLFSDKNYISWSSVGGMTDQLVWSVGHQLMVWLISWCDQLVISWWYDCKRTHTKHTHY